MGRGEGSEGRQIMKRGCVRERKARRYFDVFLQVQDGVVCVERRVQPQVHAVYQVRARAGVQCAELLPRAAAPVQADGSL